MEQEISKKRELIRRLKNKYRMLIINDSTFEERWSYLLTPLNVFTGVGITFLVFAFFLYCLIAFTPIREMIPNYPDDDIRRNAAHAAARADSLEIVMLRQQNYLNNIYEIFSGNTPVDSAYQYSADADIAALGDNSPLDEVEVPEVDNHADQQLRAQEAEKERFALGDQQGAVQETINKLYFFQPLKKGRKTSDFSVKEEHFGVDLVAAKDEPIKATLEGTIVLANWTPDHGYVIQIQHDNNFISVYKHNSVLLKKVGEHVSAGDPVAIIGNSGELTDGPHLHFELWKNRQPIDPESLMTFPN